MVCRQIVIFLLSPSYTRTSSPFPPSPSPLSIKSPFNLDILHSSPSTKTDSLSPNRDPISSDRARQHLVGALPADDLLPPPSHSFDRHHPPTTDLHCHRPPHLPPQLPPPEYHTTTTSATPILHSLLPIGLPPASSTTIGNTHNHRPYPPSIDLRHPPTATRNPSPPLQPPPPLPTAPLNRQRRPLAPPPPSAHPSRHPPPLPLNLYLPIALLPPPVGGPIHLPITSNPPAPKPPSHHLLPQRLATPLRLPTTSRPPPSSTGSQFPHRGQPSPTTLSFHLMPPHLTFNHLPLSPSSSPPSPAATPSPTEAPVDH